MNNPANEQVKTAIENSIMWYLGDQMHDATSPIATKKYLTPDNLLVTLTMVSVAETNIPKIKVQLFRRVEGGVSETGYQLFEDHRLTKYHNDMIFGSMPNDPQESASEDVGDNEAEQLLALVISLQTARQTL